MSTETVMPSDRLVLCGPLLLPPSMSDSYSDLQTLRTQCSAPPFLNSLIWNLLKRLRTFLLSKMPWKNVCLSFTYVFSLECASLSGRANPHAVSIRHHGSRTCPRQFLLRVVIGVSNIGFLLLELCFCLYLLHVNMNFSIFMWNMRDSEAWHAAIHGIMKSQT